ncbi:MAG: phosphoribosylaminoimidazolesuccinocarboxamide synthase, partial [Patescibacteria group bacterium]
MSANRFDQAGEVISEGKTKIIFEYLNDETKVLIESKDDITAGDGISKITIEGKGALVTAITRNCFR